MKNSLWKVVLFFVVVGLSTGFSLAESRDATVRQIIDGDTVELVMPPWDVDKDGVVGICDITVVVRHFGEDLSMLSHPDPDVNADGTVNILDLILVGIHYDVAVPPEETIKIAAFNIQAFGRTTRQKEEVMSILTWISRQFDVMLVQEIVDSSQTTAPFYLEKINELEGPDYAFVRSPRLGSPDSKYKEAYAYFYNTETVEFIAESDYVYDDVNDDFTREPYIASFRSGNFDFTLVGIHTRPEKAKSEIAKLPDVVASVRANNSNERDIIVLGDLNADNESDTDFNEEDDSTPLKAQKFHWVITNDMDTMTTSDWTYDRIVVTDATFCYEYVDDSAAVFCFDAEREIDDEALVWDVSDHYPVYAEFRTDLEDDD